MKNCRFNQYRSSTTTSLPAHDTMNIWSSVKRRMQTKRAKAVKKKAVAAGELVTAGVALTGGSLLLEEMVKPGEPKLAGHDNVYATGNDATLFKYETLAEQDDDGIATAQIIGYNLLVLIAIMLLFPIARAIVKIKRMCGHDVSAFEWIGSKKVKDNNPKVSNEDEHSDTPTASPLMEKALDYLNDNNILNHQHAEHNLKEAIKKARKNFVALTSIKDARTLTSLT